MVWFKISSAKWLRWLFGAGTLACIAWAVAQNQVISKLGSFLELGGQVIVSKTGQTLHSTFDLEGQDVVRWTSYFNSRINNPFETEGVLTLPDGHAWESGSLRAPSGTKTTWRVNGAWQDTEPQSGAAVTAVKWFTSSKVSTVDGEVAGIIDFYTHGNNVGYRIIPYGDFFYTIHHHTLGGRLLQCRKASDGKFCPGWDPFGYGFQMQNGVALSGDGSKMRSPHRPIEALNEKTGELFVVMVDQSGFQSYVVCTNLNTLKSCGSTPVGGRYGWVPPNWQGDMTPLGQIGSKYYILSSNGVAYVFDIVSRGVDSSRALEGGAGAYNNTNSIILDGKIYIDVHNRIWCYDPNIRDACGQQGGPIGTGWSREGYLTNRYVQQALGIRPILNSDGSAKGVCNQMGDCLSVNGGTWFQSPHTYRGMVGEGGLPGVYGGMTFRGSATNSPPGHYYWPNGAWADHSAVIGTKIYNYVWSYNNPGISCYDSATDSSCGFFPQSKNYYPYSLRVDPTRENCIMAIGMDTYGVFTDVKTGGNCKRSNQMPRSVEKTFDPGAENFKCDSSRAHISRWGKLRISKGLPWGAGNGYSSVTVTLSDVDGKLLPEEYQPVRSFTPGSYELDIGTGPNAVPYAKFPRLTVKFDFETNAPKMDEFALAVDLTYEGDPVQVCVATKAPDSPDCQTTASVTVKHRAVELVGAGFAEELTASKVLSPGGLSTGYAAFASPTTPRLNKVALSPLDPRTQIVQGRWSLQHFNGDLWAFNLSDSGQIQGSPIQSAQASTPAPGARKVFTAAPTPSGQSLPIRSLDWDQLVPEQQQALNLNAKGLADDNGIARLQYLRGTDAATFRPRQGFTLGPVINSAPVVLQTWAAESRPEEHFKGFTDYRRDSAKMRAHPLALYGGNDGALHAFEAKGDALSEAWTFVPDVLLRRSARYSDLTLGEIRSNPYFVDNVPVVGHVNTGSDASPDWRAVAVVLYGRGARAITAVDVTRTDLAHPESKGVLFEYSHASDPELKDLGYIISQPDSTGVTSSAQLVKLNNARSAVLVGNGIHSNEATVGGHAASGTGMPVLYAFYLDGREKRFHRWPVDKSTWSGADAEPGIAFENGLGMPTPLDADGDGKIDVVYAGDLQGNLWRFDVRNPDKVSVTRLFKTYDKTPADAQQPIMQAPFVTTNTLAKDCGAANAPAHARRCWQVVFATGAYISPLLGSSNVARQAVYGILDKGQGATVGQGSLVRLSYQTNRVIRGVEYRALRPSSLHYKEPQAGWRVDLQDYEHGVGAPRLQPTGLVMFSSVRPTTPGHATNVCIGPRSWLNELDPLHGYSTIVAFDTNGDGNIDGLDRFDPDSSSPISPTSMAISGAQFGAPAVLRAASTQSQQMSLLLPSLGQDTGQLDSWSGGNNGGGQQVPGANSAALTHSNSAKLGRMSWREKY